MRRMNGRQDSMASASAYVDSTYPLLTRHFGIINFTTFETNTTSSCGQELYRYLAIAASC